MAEFVQHYGALRWTVVAAFLFAAAIVVLRLRQPVRAELPGECGPAAERALWQPDSVARPVTGSHESDAAHLIMCLVMLTMLVFPAGASAHAMRGLLTAMVVVFAVLLISRITQCRTEGRPLLTDQSVPLAYHVLTAAAMLYAMSGHVAAAHTAGPAPIPAVVLAGLFLADALAVLGAVVSGRHFRWLGHPITTAGHPRLALVPHLVMDIGTAYMLVAAVSG